MADKFGLWNATLARVLVLTGLVGVGAWQVAATSVDLLVAGLAQDLQAKAKVSVEPPVLFGSALRGAAWLRLAASQMVQRARPATSRHRSFATGLDNGLLNRLGRL